MYKHHEPSTTSLSDAYDDEVDIGNEFFADDNTQPSLTPVPAQWSKKRRSPRPATKRAPKYSPMEHIPPEILMHILKHVHSARDLYSCVRVSRTWCECSVELLWHKPSFPKLGTLDKMVRLLCKPDTTFSYPLFIRRLNFLNLGSELRDDIFSLFAQCARLERLTLVGCKLVTGDRLAAILPRFPNLVAIDLTGVSETTDEAVINLAVSARRLQGINLAGCKNVTNKAILVLAHSCPQLRRVKLSGLESLTDQAISELARGCPLLLEIDLNHCKEITDVAVRDIWTYSIQMREMRLSFCPELTDKAFPAPLRSDTLNAPHPFPFGVKPDELPPLVLARSFEHLRMLDLTACSLVTDDAVEGIILHAPKIRNLVLSKCSLLTDRTVENICKLGRNLHYLHLGHANKITDRSVRTLARTCTRIRYVDFANCTLLTDMSVFELSALPKLRRIGLVRVNNLTDEAIYALAERHATLERIHLSYCDQITVMAIHFLLLKLHKLTHLSLTGVTAFRQPELQRFCREAPRDFNSAQRQAFCVYSGKGVSQLRTYLTELFDRITESNGTDDTEYEDDIDGEAYQEDTPDPETGGEDDDDYGAHEPDAEPDTNHDVALSATPQPNQPRSHEFVFQRDRPVRLTSIPVTSSFAVALTPSANLQGATTALNAQIEAATPRRIRTYLNHTVADMLPIVESSMSPAQSDAASNQSEATTQSNGAGFFRTYEEGASPRGTGVQTPDLNFAEIGHGRGTHGGNLARHGHGKQRESTLRSQPYLEDAVERLSVEGSASTSQGIQTSGRMTASWPYEEPLSAVEPSSPSIRAPQAGNARGRREERTLVPGEGRGRSVKRSIRNTLNAAEQYATSFLFGRTSTDMRDETNGSRAAGPSYNAQRGR